MLKSFTALVAFFCLGPPSLPPAPPAAPPSIPQVVSSGLSPEVLKYVPLCVIPLEDPTTPAPAIKAVLKHLKQVETFGPTVKVRLDSLIKKYAQKHGVDEKLVWTVLRQESRGNPLAVSPKGAMGLMQLMPETAESLGVQDAFDPEKNVEGGVKYLKHCLARFQQDVVLALAAYNAGPGAVEKYGGVPPYQETENYVAKITEAYTGKPWTRDDPEAAPPAPVKKEAGLDWDVPLSTWKVADPRVKVVAPKWKFKTSEVPQTQQPKERRISYFFKPHGLRPHSRPQGKFW
jgi:Transglycosylase SLT domain